MASQAHLYAECKLLPVKEHNHLLSKQFLLAFHRSDHPNNDIINCIKPARQMKLTLMSAFSNEVKSSIITPTPENYRTHLRTLHPNAVKSSMTTPNRILGF